MYNWLIFCEIAVLIYIQFIGCDDKELLRLYTMGYRKSGRCNKVTIHKLLVSLGNELLLYRVLLKILINLV